MDPRLSRALRMEQVGGIVVCLLALRPYWTSAGRFAGFLSSRGLVDMVACFGVHRAPPAISTTRLLEDVGVGGPPSFRLSCP